MEEIVRFKISGYDLIGISHVPEKDFKGIGIVLLCPGHQYRIGPHRLYVNLARELERNGYHVLRFDSEGLGDSTWNFEDTYLHEVHGRIQRGKFVRSSRKVIQKYRKEKKLSKIIVSGLCGGSLTGLLTSKCCGDIDALIGLGLPTFYSDVSETLVVTDIKKDLSAKNNCRNARLSSKLLL